MFLSRTEIEELTGYQRPSAQSRWLDRNGFNHVKGADGYPRVLRNHVQAKLGSSVEFKQEGRPNFAALFG
ncbi:MAG: hypothetical protein B6D70_07680 [gamma proteobacterium symbiont of Stewartia floridana]|nr:MAG: hypothetical protein B6D70_07680 [gamma proteobacterium symbiont of Stewartia floridana]